MNTKPQAASITPELDGDLTRVIREICGVAAAVPTVDDKDLKIRALSKQIDCMTAAYTEAAKALRDNDFNRCSCCECWYHESEAAPDYDDRCENCGEEGEGYEADFDCEE